jgi:hypothetical protein
MGKSRVMGAGFAGSSIMGVNTNSNTSGGSKKQGLASRVGRNHWSNFAIQAQSNGSVKGRNTVFFLNQLGGVGRGNSQFSIAGSFARKDGVRRR